MLLLRRLPFAAAFCFLALAAAARAETIKVGSSPQLQTIQDAVDAALANADAHDTVAIPAGLYDETVSITLTGTNAQESLTLKRSGTGTVVITGQVNQPAIGVSDASGIVLKNLVVQSGTLAAGGSDDDIAAIRVTGAVSNVVIDGCTGVAGDDVGIDLASTTRGVEIRNGNFSGLSRIAFRIAGTDHALESCLANGSGHNGFLLLAGSENCRLKACSGIGLQNGDPDEPGYFTIRGRGHEIEDCDVASGREGFFVAGSGHRFVDCSSTANNINAFVCEATDSSFDRCEGSMSVIGFVGGGAGVVIDDSKFPFNTSHGMAITGDRTKVIGTACDQNGGSGVFVLSSASGAHLRDVKAKTNGVDGIRVEGDTCWLEDNVTGGGDGIIDAGTDNAGRGNLAKGGATNDFP